MTRKELIKDLALHNDIAGNTEAAAERILDAILETITTNIINGNEVALGQKFGTFQPAVRSARTGTSFGKEWTKPATNVIKFSASAPLVRLIAGE